MTNTIFSLKPQAIAVQGCSLNFWVYGTGPALLLIQGTGIQGFGWMPQLEDLCRDFTCIWFDNRGMSLSQPQALPLTVELMASDAFEVLQAAGFQSAHVVGHSLGGLIAQQLALVHPKAVQSLSLLCTFSAGSFVAPLTGRMMWLGLQTQIGTLKMRRLGFLKLVMPPGPIAEANILAERVGILFGHDLGDQPKIVLKQLKATRQCNLTDELQKITSIPTLIVSATHDPIAPPSAGKIIASKIPQSRYVEIPDSSHGLPISHAREVNQLLRDHLKA